MISKLQISFLIVLTGLGACQSFNRYEIIAPPQTQSKSPSHLKCPVYVLPDFDPVPAVPYEQLQKLAQGDNQTFDHAAQQHIVELHAYIRDMKRKLADSHEQYLRDCLK
jgi:hypothetical protein